MKTIKRKQFNRYIEKFEFAQLFNQLGWNYVDQTFPKKAGDRTFEFQHIADKEGFAILICQPDSEGQIPDAQTRKRIHTEIAKLHHEHLIIFIDRDKTMQQWELLFRQPNKPARTIGHKWRIGQAPELLYQKLSGAFFTMAEDESGELTIIDVVQRMRDTFGVNAEKVTKKFYDEFKKHHTKFLDFIKGIDDAIPDKDNANKQWYASIMLNRLMFCYFIQKKGFLDQDKDYLKNKLNACQKLVGKGNFYSFYRSFLLELFHDGLGQPIHKRKNDLPVELGKIPYLNGGLFDVHELEHQFNGIHIDDAAFERIFNFFDQWEWHLDTREHTDGNTINPDVIGYIFEKYINDRAAMGAYYTKEDITDYIGKNTIIPFLFDETERHYKAAFKPGSDLWNFLKTSGDAYIYDAVKKGVPTDGGLFDDLPPEIQTGFRPDLENQIVTADTAPHLWEIRKEWNRPAPADIGLPTEIYRELIERRTRYAEVKAKIENGEINHINDFITYNLNIRQFTQDVVETSADPDLIRHFYKALTKVTILDPTCGSGAFLFAAMNILEPLYETCLKRMEEFTDEQPGKHKFFAETLAQVNSDDHPNRPYFIFKSIILNNLYGVDIMKEAVEIAKLRLFLKLVATVDVEPSKANFGLEPLPDIDFNIRAGNTLVGFATEAELKASIQGITQGEMFTADGKTPDQKLAEFKEEFELVSQAFRRFQNSQLLADQGSADFRAAKSDLLRRLRDLNQKLNVYLAANYGIDADKKPADYQQWLTSHQPFHWFAEFYEIVAENGGFDVIIGNPPYVVYSSQKVDYKVRNYQTESSKNLYCFVYERALILSKKSKVSFIVQLTVTSSEKIKVLQDILIDRGVFFVLSFPRRPKSVFTDVEMPVSIVTSFPLSSQLKISSSDILRFYSDERDVSINNFSYLSHNIRLNDYRIAKIDTHLCQSVFQKIIKSKNSIDSFVTKTSNSFVYYQEACRYWMKAHLGNPFFKRNGEMISPPHGRIFHLVNEKTAAFVTAIMNSSLFYWFYSAFSDCEHVNDNLVKGFFLPFNWDETDWLESSQLLLKDLDANANRKEIRTNQGHVIEYDEINAAKSKPIIDQIDTVLAAHYGFTEAELDFIINYDIKYRMGKSLPAYIAGRLSEETGSDEDDDND